MIPARLLAQLPTLLAEAINQPVSVTNVKPLGGGCINSASRIDTDVNPFFIKWNSASRYPRMFETEAKGLELLNAANTVRIPKVVLCGEVDGDSFLILEYLDAAQQSSNFWDEFGLKLANLHRNTQGQCGLDHDNYIGSLPQYNKPHSSWTEFFLVQRLEIQARQAFNDGLLARSDLQAIDRLGQRLESIFPEEPPSLLHGDLWSGNYMTGPQGEACIIDPAVYYGHREMDLGMSKLFGGFSSRFYESYHDAWSLEKGWQQRIDICNLYPLLVHVNLFGSGYVSQVRGILRKF